MAGALVSAVKAAIQAKGYGTDTTTVQLVAINAAQRRVLGQKRWKFLEATSTSVTVIGTANYALPADLRDIDAVRLSTAGSTNDFNLRWLEPADLLNRLNIDATPDVPLFWTHTRGQVYLWPSPSAVYTMTFDYTKTVSDLASDGDITTLPAVYMDVLVWSAVKDLAYRQRDWRSIPTANAEYMSALREMIAAEGIDQRQGTREVGHWAGWDQYS